MAITVERWQFINPTNGDFYRFPNNPSEMSEVFPQRNITAATTAALNGQPLLWEGNIAPWEWTFSGDILTKAHYDAMQAWFYDRSMGTFRIRDHFGRLFDVAPIHFKPKPKTTTGKYWRHTYDCRVLVLAMPTAATIGEKWS